VIPRWEGQPLRMHAREVSDAATLEALAMRILNHWRAPADATGGPDDRTGHAP